MTESKSPASMHLVNGGQFMNVTRARLFLVIVIPSLTELKPY